MVRVVVDDDRGACDHDHEADPRLYGVAQVAEQQRGTEPRDEDPRLAPTIRPPSTKESAADASHSVAGAANGKRSTRQQGEDSSRDRDRLEPQQPAVRPVGVVPREGAHRARDGGGHDEYVEAVPLEEHPWSAHVVNVCQRGRSAASYQGRTSLVARDHPGRGLPTTRWVLARYLASWTSTSRPLHQELAMTITDTTTTTTRRW